jgi:hypothetical protein
MKIYSYFMVWHPYKFSLLAKKMELPHTTTLLVFGSIVFIKKLDHNFKWELKSIKTYMEAKI